MSVAATDIILVATAISGIERLFDGLELTSLVEIYTWILSFPFDARYGVLIGVCFFLSVYNTSVGPSGGMMFAALATCLPATAVVPVHAMLQGGSTFVRLLILRGGVDTKIVWGFCCGGVVGFCAGGWLYAFWQPPADVLQLLLGVFILVNLVQACPSHPSQSNVRYK